MERQEQLYRGAVILPGETDPTPRVELWAVNRTVAAFPTDGALAALATLHNVELEFDPDGYLVVTGDEGVIRCAQLPQPEGIWQGMVATFPDGHVVKDATVRWSNVGVTISGTESHVLPGARTHVVGALRFVAPFASGPEDEITLARPRKPGCGSCGG